MRAGRSTHMWERVESVAAALRAGSVQSTPTKTQVLKTRRSGVRGWLGVRETLRASGREGLANEVEHSCRPPQTERDWIAQGVLERVGDTRRKMQLTFVR